jgi:hypothetical protein
VAARRAKQQPVAVRITTAPASHRDDLNKRRRRYLVSMAVRTICFVGAIFIGGWVRWVLLSGAFILPYVAVVMANASTPRIPGTDLVGPYSGHKELG